MRFEIRLRAVATRPQPSINFLKSKQISVRVSFFFPSSPHKLGSNFGSIPCSSRGKRPSPMSWRRSHRSDKRKGPLGRIGGRFYPVRKNKVSQMPTGALRGSSAAIPIQKPFLGAAVGLAVSRSFLRLDPTPARARPHGRCG